jgi:multidrug efflux system membrane fusion protein
MRAVEVVAVAMVAGALAAACSRTEPYQKPLTPVQVRTVEPAGAPTPVRYSAVIEPRSRVDLAFRVGGYIDDLATVGGRTIQEGDRVTRGMMLARLRASDYDERIKQARSQVAEAEAAVSASKAAFDRAGALFKSKSLSRPEYEQAQAAYETTQAKLSGAQALVQQAENARGDSVLTSPIDGIVIRRLVEVGSLVGPGTGGFVLADISSVRAIFGAPDTMLKVLKVGAAAPVRSEALPGRQFEGRVTNIAPNADPRSRVFDVEVTIANGDGALKVGMVAVVAIDDGAERRQQAPLAVPLSAIVRSKEKPDGYAVFVVEEAQGRMIARLRDVTLGQMLASEIAVTGGLRQGERVIVSGVTMVADGETVSIVP